MFIINNYYNVEVRGPVRGSEDVKLTYHQKINIIYNTLKNYYIILNNE
jgi:hypothetical protein